MRMRLALAAAGLAIGTLVGATVAQAATVDLSADFSNTANPNGNWSIKNGTVLLPHQASATPNGNHLIPALPSDGFFGTGPDLNANTPFVFKADQNGGTLSGLSDSDFLADDIVVHSPNDGSDLIIQWRASSPGTITNLDVSVWYAHSSVTRSNDVELALAGSVLANWTVSTADNDNRNDPGTYADAGPIEVHTGDLLTISFAKTIGQGVGTLNGIAASFDFVASTVPVPAALPLFVSALAGLGWFARRRKQAAA